MVPASPGRPRCPTQVQGLLGLNFGNFSRSTAYFVVAIKNPTNNFTGFMDIFVYHDGEVSVDFETLRGGNCSLKIGFQAPESGQQMGDRSGVSGQKLTGESQNRIGAHYVLLFVLGAMCVTREMLATPSWPGTPACHLRRHTDFLAFHVGYLWELVCLGGIPPCSAGCDKTAMPPVPAIAAVVDR